MKKKVERIYKDLFKLYGPQGWWPLLEVKGTNPTKSGTFTGYHINNYQYPQNNRQIFEICVGAILTQNTAWTNVEKALKNLHTFNYLDPQVIKSSNEEQLQELIRPSGYFKQKAKKLKLFSEFFLHLKGKKPCRNVLLSVWGVGPETADSILLYAYNVPTFVVDTYTKRIFSHLNLIDENQSYDEIKSFFENNLKKDVIVYQEFHALIVEHAKHYYSKKPYGTNCPL